MKYLKFFIIALSISFLSGCSDNNQDKATTVTIWHWMSDRDSTFQELAEKYHKETGKKVRFDLYAPSEAYSQRIRAAAQTTTLPDVFGILGEKRDYASFIKSGHISNLSEDLSKSANGQIWKDSLFDKALVVNEFLPENEYGVTPGIYGVPLDVTTIQMVYNKSLYTKAGLNPDSPPATWAEFMAHAKQLKSKGVGGFVSGFGEIWMIEALATNFAMNIMGEKKVYDTYRGLVPYTDPDWKKVFSLFKQMTDEKVFVDGTVTMVNKIAEQTFANERATYAFNGSWCVNVYRGMNPNLQYSAILPPKPNPANPMKIWGGAGSSFLVNANSPRKAEAIAFLRWLTDAPQQAYLSKMTHNLPANKQSLSEIVPLLAEFADDMENAVHPNNYPVHESPEVSEALSKGIQFILIGEKTPDAVAADIQKIKEKQLKKLAAA